MGVQRELLKMLEASEVVVPLELTHSTYADHVVMSTADIAFIAAGAFSGFQQVAHRRGDARPDRLRPRPGRGRPDPDAIAVDFTAEQVENVANFQAYGFLPELIARFTRVVPFKALDAGTLKDILRTNVIERLTREFEDEGFELVIDEAVLDHVVDERPPRDRRARPGVDPDPPPRGRRVRRVRRRPRRGAAASSVSRACCSYARGSRRGGLPGPGLLRLLGRDGLLQAPA